MKTVWGEISGRFFSVELYLICQLKLANYMLCELNHAKYLVHCI